MRMTARSTALTNAARGALWLKTWPGDATSKSKLCGIPFMGDLLSCPDLDLVLDRIVDKNYFRIKKEKQPAKRLFRPQRSGTKQ